MASQLGPVLNKGLRMRLLIIGLHKLYTLIFEVEVCSTLDQGFHCLKVIVLSSIVDKISRVLKI